MSMSSLSFESDQHEAGLFEYVVKMSHTERSEKTSSHVLPVRFRTCVHPLTDLPQTVNTALVATPGLLEEFESTTKPSEGDVPPVILRLVKHPQPQPEPLVDADTVPKEPAAPAADPVFPSEAPSEPTRDEPDTQSEPAKETEGGGSQPEKKGREHQHHHSHHSHQDKEDRKKHSSKKKKKDKSEKKRHRERDSQRKEGGKQRHSSGDVDGTVGRNMRAAPMHPAKSADGDTAAMTEEEEYHRQNMILQERLRLTRRRQQQQRQMQVALQEVLSKTCLKQERIVKDGRRRDSALIQQLLDGSFPLARTTIAARKYSLAHSVSEPPESARTQDT